MSMAFSPRVKRKLRVIPLLLEGRILHVHLHARGGSKCTVCIVTLMLTIHQEASKDIDS